MNITDNIVGFLILSILLISTLNYVGGILNLSYISQNNFLATALLEESELLLRTNIKNIQVDRNMDNYQVGYKNEFLNKAFVGVGINLPSNVKEGSAYKCYNYSLEDNAINIHKEMDINADNNYDESLFYTDEDGKNTGYEFLNIICLYNTYNYIGYNNIINTDNSPLAYVLYSSYKDNNSINRITEKKGILYFN